ncbi:MAG: helix-turn-helix transcriptional regulator [Acidobacteria bacterium]|nr:helix-turn-helix transcriptional regulator [Acidobacteriota bacterium]
MADTAFWLELKGKFGSLKGDFVFLWSSAGTEEDILTRERGHSGWIFWQFPDEAGRHLFEGYSKMGAQALLGDAVTDAWLDELKRRRFGFEVDANGTTTLEDGTTIPCEVGSIGNAVGASVDLCELLSVDAHLQTRSARVSKQHSAASPEESARSEQPKVGSQDEPAGKLGAALKAARRRAEWSQAQLAEKLGCSVDAVQDHESGRSYPSKLKRQYLNLYAADETVKAALANSGGV